MVLQRMLISFQLKFSMPQLIAAVLAAEIFLRVLPNDLAQAAICLLAASEAAVRSSYVKCLPKSA